MEHTVNETLVYVISLAGGVRSGDISAAILAVLIELELQSCADGFGYLRKAILIRCQNPHGRLSDIYEQIARESDPGTTVNQIEQAILSVIENAWKNRDPEKWDYFFSERKTGTRKKPGNKEFIARMACIMELWCSHCQEADCKTGSR